MEGLSVRTILVNAFFQIVILLYLLEHQTSWIVLASVAVGAVIEVWKIFRAIRLKVVITRPFGSRLSVPWVSFEDRSSYVDSRTREYDQMAMRYLSMVAVPLLLGYAVYSLVYEEHRSWRAWILSSMVGWVYAFGKG